MTIIDTVTMDNRHPTTDALIHWNFRGECKPARFLLRYSAAVPKIAILSELAYPDPEYSPLNQDVAGAANAAWAECLSVSGFDAPSIRWIVHTGPFSTHDRLWTTEHESFFDFDVRYERGSFAFGIDDDGRRICANDIPFDVRNVPEIVEQLEGAG